MKNGLLFLSSNVQFSMPSVTLNPALFLFVFSYMST